jgi:predicted nucleic acid-binding protein
MKVFFDTSVLIAALIEKHEFHAAAAPWLDRVRGGEMQAAMATHSFAELYATLTRLPYNPRISPSVAWELIKENLQGAVEAISLSSDDYLATLIKSSSLGISGGTIYDALIALAAAKSNADKLLTFNPSHFKRVWPEGADRIQVP